jgi:hypothetical protein
VLIQKKEIFNQKFATVITKRKEAVDRDSIALGIGNWLALREILDHN